MRPFSIEIDSIDAAKHVVVPIYYWKLSVSGLNPSIPTNQQYFPLFATKQHYRGTIAPRKPYLSDIFKKIRNLPLKVGKMRNIEETENRISEIQLNSSLVKVIY